MNVLIIPEDFRKDQYILKPLFSRLFQSMGRRHVQVEVCRDPPLGGFREALKTERMAEVVNERAFLAENAWEEIETWVLAGLRLPSDWSWAEVRAEIHVKEEYFDRLVVERGLSDAPGDGRKPLGEEASRRIDAIRQKCPEDFDALAGRLGTAAGVT